MKKAYFYDTKIGRIGIAEQDGKISNVFFGNTVSPETYTIEETCLLKDAAEQLNTYLEGKCKSFDLPLMPEGTPFERSVWQALTEIPYGETRSYEDIAIHIGNPKACRAVGGANNRNPIAIIVPCHRVIGKSGKMIGYAGGLEIKETLLKLESES